MSNHINRSRNNSRGNHQKLSDIEEEMEMKTASHTGQLSIRLPGILNKKTTAKLLGGIALGAMLMTATALPFGSAHADDPARPLSREAGISYNQQLDQLLEWEGISGSHAGAAKLVRRSTFTNEEKLDQINDWEGAAKVTRSAGFTYQEQLVGLTDIEGAPKVTRNSGFALQEQLVGLMDIEGAPKVTRNSGFTYEEQLEGLMDIEGAPKVTRPSGFTHQEKMDQINDWESNV